MNFFSQTGRNRTGEEKMKQSSAPSGKQDLLRQSRLTPGVCWEDELLIIPPEGGGLVLPDLSGTNSRWLNLTLTVEEGHAQAFEFRFFAEEEAPRVIIRFGMMPRFRAAMAVDLNLLDGHCLFPGHRAGTQKVVCHGSRIRRDEIRRTEWVAMASAHPVHVRAEAMTLSDEPGPVLPLPEEPLIDAWGQYLPANDSRRIRSDRELKTALKKEAEKQPAWPYDTRTVWGGNAEEKLTEGTGYFGKVRYRNRWYLTDPSGCAFFSLGPDCVAARCDARIDGLQPLLQDLPERGKPENAFLFENLRRDFGETPRENGLLFSYERSNLRRVFGTAWETVWRKMIVSQLMQMGCNTLGNWSDPALFGRMPYVTSLPEFPSTSHCIFRDFPDVLSEEYLENARRCSMALAARSEDPWMVGYFLRNEPAWAFVDNLIIADEVLRDPADTACRRGLIRFLQERYRDAAALSEAWEHPFASFDDLLLPLEKASSFSGQARKDLRAFSAVLTRAYTEIPSRCCREADPHHMILGMRWAWISDPLLVSGWDCFDVFSINCYAVDPTPALENVRRLGVDLPVMIGEFHFGALDAGLPATGLEAVAGQRERGKAFRYYCERTAAHPNGVGCHWFQCYDQFALGRFDGENYNIGLFDITLRPYPEMEEAVRRTAEQIFRVMAGQEQPFGEKPLSLPMIAY